MPTEHLLLYSPFNRGHWRQSNHKKSFLQENRAVIYIHGNETWCQARLSPFTEPPLRLFRSNAIPRTKLYCRFLGYCRTCHQQDRPDGKDEVRMTTMFNGSFASDIKVCKANCDWLLKAMSFLYQNSEYLQTMCYSRQTSAQRRIIMSNGATVRQTAAS